jgi:hypothetical protein
MFTATNSLLFRVLFLLTALNAVNLPAQQVNHWETVVLAGDEWAYFSGQGEPDSAWFTAEFNDSSWARGPAGIGYGDEDDQTVIDPALALYMRRAFQIIDTSVISAALLHMDYDDAFVAYLNGTEIARSNIGVPGVRPLSEHTAAALHEALMYTGGRPESYYLSDDQRAGLLRPGVNILALQVHNENIGSSDLSAIPFFSVGITDGSFTYHETPDWFYAETGFFSGNLPLLIIDTQGNTIEYDEKVTARMGIIDNAGQPNNSNDPFNAYDGWIGIEFHGQSSLSFAKKSYGLETRDSLGDNQNVSLLGLPVENDWILHGPYSDKSQMRNALAYTLAAELGRYAPGVRFCEVIINQEYRGIYILTEKIKLDNDRVDITRLQPQDITEPQVSGGYIFKKDKINEGDNIINLNRGQQLIITEPKSDLIVPEQQNWLVNHLNDFEDVLYSGGDYSAWIDVVSFADNFLMVELAKNIDGFRLSTYFYKDRNEKIVAAPVWDYNLSFGNADYNDGWIASGWYYTHIGYDNNWWLHLVDDVYFQNLCKTRWTLLRSGPFSEEHIFNLIDNWSELLQEAQSRNFMLYPVLGIYLWPNPGFPQSGSFGYNAPTDGGPVSWEEEIANLKSFIHQRLLWMDENLPGTLISGLNNDISEAYTDAGLPFPNPFNSNSKIIIKINNPGPLSLVLYSITGQIIKSEILETQSDGTYVFAWDGTGNSSQPVASGVYFFVVRAAAEIIHTGKFVKID